MNPLPIIVSLLVTAVTLFIISKLPTGVEIDSLGKAFLSAVVFGILNALLHPILSFITLPITFITFGFRYAP
jgi:putative membrane protein